jgi:hypothetical protein
VIEIANGPPAASQGIDQVGRKSTFVELENLQSTLFNKRELLEGERDCRTNEDTLSKRRNAR